MRNKNRKILWIEIDTISLEEYRKIMNIFTASKYYKFIKR